MANTEWGGFGALRFVLNHALYVRDDKWIEQMLGQVDLHLQTQEELGAEPERTIDWAISPDAENFQDAAVSATLIWLGCSADFREWFVNEMNAHSGRLMDAHEEYSQRKWWDRGPNGDAA